MLTDLDILMAELVALPVVCLIIAFLYRNDPPRPR
jgi:hypothetical protein